MKRVLLAVSVLCASCALTEKSVKVDVTDTVSFVELGQLSLVGFERRSEVLPTPNPGERFQLDADTGAFLMLDEAGRVTRRADFQYVGVHVKERFLWAWSSKSMPAERIKLAAAVRAYGEKRGFPMLTGNFSCSEEEAIAPVAIALELGGADAWYRYQPTRDATVYIALFGVELVKEPK